MSKPLKPQHLMVMGFALIITMFPFAPTPSWACSAGGGGAFSYGSQTGGGSVTVCARAVVESRSVVVAKSAPRPVVAAPKPAPKPIASAPKSAPKPVVAAPKPVTRLFAQANLNPPPSLLKPIAKPKAAPKPAPKPPAPVPNKPAVIVLSSASNGQASFSPAPLTALADPPNLTAGEATTLTANPMLHFQSGALLGKATDVRFEPISTSWNFGDGSTGSGSTAAHAYAADGQYRATAMVTYAVYYQIAGQTGWVSGGQITVSDAVLIQVSAGGIDLPIGQDPVSPPAVVRLVGKNCLISPGAYGCSA